MGNTESNVTSSVKKQSEGVSQPIYQLVDLKDGGELITMMKEASKTKNYDEVEKAIRTKVEPFLYNKGEGMLIPISEIVITRNKDRPKHKQLPIVKSILEREAEKKEEVKRVYKPRL